MPSTNSPLRHLGLLNASTAVSDLMHAVDLEATRVTVITQLERSSLIISFADSNNPVLSLDIDH